MGGARGRGAGGCPARAARPEAGQQQISGVARLPSRGPGLPEPGTKLSRVQGRRWGWGDKGGLAMFSYTALGRPLLQEMSSVPSGAHPGQRRPPWRNKADTKPRGLCVLETGPGEPPGPPGHSGSALRCPGAADPPGRMESGMRMGRRLGPPGPPGRRFSDTFGVTGGHLTGRQRSLSHAHAPHRNADGHAGLLSRLPRRSS